ncbi:MAG: hypothetical protein ILO10_05940 [Kiritimatiellae bacterium]|nr:hypothetical protein [Kiritimatiellia bacterium]
MWSLGGSAFKEEKCLDSSGHGKRNEREVAADGNGSITLSFTLSRRYYRQSVPAGGKSAARAVESVGVLLQNKANELTRDTGTTDFDVADCKRSGEGVEDIEAILELEQCSHGN